MFVSYSSSRVVSDVFTTHLPIPRLPSPEPAASPQTSGEAASDGDMTYF